ncbi:uncharacterized protein LOC130112693 [Lampris incognitus]|uniref:uncharacterized protein LOC130112693 n=1 Tax=Lampris incognitus TaxID=2546036 RepID=UPI0024B4D7DB|nr:uncharacterized protein LOC130112693 [Lampris incognitus]XP_056136130.1 uncharacterized protein LOC130112693 [Lampris incognitus]
MRTPGGTFFQLILLPILLEVYMSPSLQANDCPSRSSHESLSCVNDFNNNITCVWNSANNHAPCSLYTFRKRKMFTKKPAKSTSPYNASCDLEPFDPFKPALRRCSLILGITRAFMSFTEQELRLTCKPLNYSLSLTYKPNCHIKLTPPGVPDVNLTTISWPAGAPSYIGITQYSFHFQWKQEAQSWKDASERNKTKEQCNPVCQMELNPDLLEQGKRYEARIRVQSGEDWSRSVWSEWSPTAKWVSAVGKEKAPDDPNILEWDTLVGSVVGAVFLLSLGVFFCKRDENIWVCTLKKFVRPPIPNPGQFLRNDGNYQVWLASRFTNDSYLLKPVDICSVEVTSTVESVVTQDSEAALLGKRRWDSCCRLTSSRYSDPVRPLLCPPPLSFCTEGNLKPCAADSPYGPTNTQSEEAKDSEEERGVDTEVCNLLSRTAMRGGSVQESLDGDRVQKLRAQRFELQSPDSGMGCSEVEQVSEESMEEVDGMDSSRGYGEQLQEKGREEEKGKERDVSRIFGGVFSQGSIQVCPDYEHIEKMRAPYPELQCADSSISGHCKEQVSEEGQEEGDSCVGSKATLYPASCIPQDSQHSFIPRSFNPWQEMKSQLGPLTGHLSEGIPAIPCTRSLEPSGVGYMPVGEAQN